MPRPVASRIAETSGRGEAAFTGQAANDAAIKRNSELTQQGADPDKVGEQVVQAMQDRQFFIFTHLDWEPLVEAVHDEIRQAFRDFDGRHGPDISAKALIGGLNPVAT